MSYADGVERENNNGQGFHFLQLTACVGAAICAALNILLIWDKALHVAMPLIGIELLIQSRQEWRKNRISAILGFCAALFIFIYCAVVWFMK